MKKLIALLFAAALLCAQTPNCTPGTQVFTAAAPGVAFANKPTISGGNSCNGWIVDYWTDGATGVSVQIEGAPDVAGHPGSWSVLTATSFSANPATATARGEIYACCDFYPWLRINPTVFTGSSQTMTVRINGFLGSQVVAAGPSGAGITQLTGDGTAGPGSGSQALTVNESGNLKGGVLGSVPYQSAPGTTGMTAANNGTLPECLVETGTGSGGDAPLFAPCPSQSALIFYLQNSVLTTATYSSGGSFSGSGNCTLTAFNGGGQGATATIAVSSGTPGAITVTAAGTNYTSAPTTATVGSAGGCTGSGTATITSTLNVPASDLTPDFPMLQMPYSPFSTMLFALTLNTAGTLPVATWVTPSGVPGLTFIPAGLYQFHVHAARTNAFTGTVQLQGVIQEVDATGHFIATIGTTELTPNLTITPTDYTLDFADGNTYTFASTSSRVALLVQSVQTSFNVAGNIQLLVGGTADPHLLIPTSGPVASGITQLTTDVTAGPGSGTQAATVVGLKTVPFCTGYTPTNGQFVQYTTGGTPNPCYSAAGASGSGITTLTQDVSAGPGSGSQAATVVGINAVPLCSGFSPSNGQFLQYTTGGSPNPCYTAASGGGGGGALVLLEEHTASNQQFLNFTSWSSATYDEYLIEVLYMTPASNAQSLYFQVSTDGGSTYVSSGYEWAYYYLAPSSNGNGGSASTFAIQLCDTVQNTVALGGCSNSIKFFVPNTVSYSRFTFHGAYGNSVQGFESIGFGSFDSTTPINAFRFSFGSGNISTGIARVYGLTH